MRRATMTAVGVVLALSAGPLRAQEAPAAADVMLDKLQQELNLQLRELERTADNSRRPQAVGRGIIRGTVTAAANGAPLRGATVRAVFGSGDAPPATAVTDDNGAFELHGLAAGSWQLSASKSGYVPRQFGQRGPSGRGAFATVTEREPFTANLTLFRGSAVTGRVFDEFGDPAVGARVQAMQLTSTSDGKRLVAAGTPDVTDDTGAFRVYGLLPGDYLLSARAPTPFDTGTFIVGERVVLEEKLMAAARTSIVPPPGFRGRSAPTYFPGTPDLGVANRITIEAGEERSGLDFALTHLEPVRVAGTIVSSAGQPPTGSVVVSLISDSADTSAIFAMNGFVSNGAFEFRDVPPGSYVLNVSMPNPGRSEMAELPLRVTEDIIGLEVVTAPGVAMSGTVVTDGTALPNARGMVVRATPVSGRRPMGGSTSGAVIDGAFSVPNLLGAFRLAIQGVPAGWILKSIEIDGVDVTDSVITFAPGQRPNATVTLTNRVTELSGLVTDDDRKAIDADVAIFPDDPAKWTSPRFVRTLRASREGTFSLRGLPPHDNYLAVATDYVDENELRNPEFLQQLRSRASSFALEAGQSRRIDLTFVERSAIDGR